MTVPPLCIIQARLKSTRLPNKMLLELGGETLIARGWLLACEMFGSENCVVAIPIGDIEGPLAGELRRIGARFFAFAGDEGDVLGRFHACAHAMPTRPETLIIRVTPDDFPIDVTRERFSRAWLDEQHATVTDPYLREHIGLLIPQRIEINTAEDYELAKLHVQHS